MAGDESGSVQPDEWIGLADALALVLRAAEAKWQVEAKRSWLSDALHWANGIPGPEVFEKLLRRHAETTVSPPPLSKMKARSLERKLGEPAGTFKSEGRDRRPLRLSETALVEAHLHLMWLFRRGHVRTRAIDCSAPLRALLNPDAAAAAGIAARPTEMSPDVWSAPRGEDKRRRRGANASPVPDYRENWLAPVVDLDRMTQTEFRSIEVSKADLLVEILTMPIAHEVAGGIFRAVLTEQGTMLEIECLGQRAIVEPTLGLGAIGVLLSRPDVSVQWEHLDGAARAFGEGEEAEKAVLEGEGAFSPGLPSDAAVREIAAEEEQTIIALRDLDRAVGPDKKEIDWVNRRLEQRRRTLLNASPELRIRLETEIAETEAFKKQLENDSRRWERPTDKLRQGVYHALENGLSRLASVCMPLAVHLGTLHKDQRNRLRVEGGAIAYRPGASVIWETTPLASRQRGSLRYRE